MFPVESAPPTSITEDNDLGLTRPRDQITTREDPRSVKYRNHSTAALLTGNDGHVASA
jgi:hypothetical protein